MGWEDRLPLKASGLATTDSVIWAIGMTGLWGGLWGVLFSDDDDDDDDGGLRNRLARNVLVPKPGGALFLKFVVSGVL